MDEQQWKNRPRDEFFNTLQALRKRVAANRDNSYERPCQLELLKVRADDNEVLVYDKRNPQGGALTSHYSFMQICARAKAPAGFLRTLSADLAVEVLNSTLMGAEPGEGKLLIMREVGQELLRLRAITGAGYGRIWDVEVLDGIINLCGDDWTETESTTLASSLNDRDMFVFLVNPKHSFRVPSGIPKQKEHEIQPGVFVQNSETGKNVFAVTTMLYNRTTDARLLIENKKEKRLRIRHNRRAPTRFMQEAMPELEKHLHVDVSGELEAFDRAKKVDLGDVDHVKVWMQRHNFAAQVIMATGVTLRKLPAGPLSLLNLINALTEVAKEMPFMDERIELERRAGKLLLDA